MVGQRIEYVHMSSLDQNEKRQLEGQVLDRVFMDKASGRDTARPQRDGRWVVLTLLLSLAWTPRRQRLWAAAPEGAKQKLSFAAYTVH
ncbi:hypothetical protein ARTHRO9AX_10305 [Arthrobacter sp. 9AX]|nr:hypothetical protein ARTHRO9AX_10305 [Arthrobacter sp. 9AX]